MTMTKKKHNGLIDMAQFGGLLIKAATIPPPKDVMHINLQGVLRKAKRATNDREDQFLIGHIATHFAQLKKAIDEGDAALISTFFATYDFG